MNNLDRAHDQNIQDIQHFLDVSWEQADAIAQEAARHVE